MKKIFALFAAATLAVCSLSAQELANFAMGGGNRIVSPEVKDGKVTFRLNANYATRVQLSGNWMANPWTGTEEMTKGTDGIWEITIDAPEPDLADWRAMVERIEHCPGKVKIALVGKYVALHDAYLSVAEALRHAGYAVGAEVTIDWIDSEALTDENACDALNAADGIIVPGGFGARGIDGMIAAVKYARENMVPCFGICLGMQIMVIEFARNAAGLADAHSGEFDPDTPHRVIDFMPGQSDEVDKGGTLRLGAYPCAIVPGTTMADCYGKTSISERHRHRYEFNNDYREILQRAGLTLSGLSPDGTLVETVELSDPGRPFFVGVQYHPEFKSRPNKPHPLFLGFVRAAKERQKTDG